MPSNDDAAGLTKEPPRLAAVEDVPAPVEATPDAEQAAPVASTAHEQLAPIEDEGVAYEPNVALVQVSDGATAAEVTRALAAAGVTPVREIADADMVGGIATVELPGDTSVSEALAAIQATGDDGVIMGAQPNFAYRMLDVDASAADLTNVVDAADGSVDGTALGIASAAAGKRSEQPMAALAATINDPRAGSQWALASVGAYDAWSIVTAERPTTGAPVTVAVLDAGFDITHEDLAANVVAPYNAHAGGTSAAALAGFSHGTHVTGIISAVSDNAKGVSGVSHNARVMPIKVTDNTGVAYTSDLVRAYSYLSARAAAYNVRVVNISMGGAGSVANSDDALLAAIDRAFSAGIVTVAAAGNAGTGTPVPYDNYPGDYGTVVSVMNLCQQGSGVTLADSSNRNAPTETDKNICAPGTAILSTLPNNAYGSMTGTSMASPCVAGIVALEFAANPDLSAADAKSILYSTATDLGAVGFDAVYGHGEVDARAAVTAVRRAADAQDALRRAAEEEAARKAAEEAAQKAIEEARRKAAEEEAARKAAEEAARKVAEVQALIDALPDPVAVSESSVQQVAAARTAYDALEAELRVSVDATRLHAAEQAVSRLQRGSAEQLRVPSVLYAVRSSFLGLSFVGRSGSCAGLAGTSPLSRLTAFSATLGDLSLPGGIQYRSYVQRQGWRNWALGGTWSGSQAYGISALQMRLTGQAAEHFDVCYRVYSRGDGWGAWVRNGTIAGRMTSSGTYQLQATQVVVVRKGAAIS